MALITGTADADSLVTKNMGADTLVGYDGDDTLDGGLGFNRLIGGRGNDRYILRSSLDTVIEQADEGVDTVQAAFSVDLRKASLGFVENVVLAGTGNYRIDGSALDNTLTGNGGANLIFGYDGADLIDGLAGNDKLDGGAGNDTLYGGAGKDSLLGGVGDDLLDGGAGVDTLAGGAGHDRYVLDTSADVVIEATNAGGDGVIVNYAGDVNLSTWANVENAQLGAQGAANLTGTAVANVLIGNAAANGIDAQAGDDTLNGGAGADTLKGGAGNDVYLFAVGDGQDLVIDADGQADKLVFNGQAAGDLQFSQVGGDLVIRYGVADQVTVQAWFSAGANTIETIVTSDVTLDRQAVANRMVPGKVQMGTAGNDTLVATDLGQPDTLIGGAGDDTYRIASALDVVVEQPGEGVDTIFIKMGEGGAYSLATADGAGVENLIATADSTGVQHALTGNDLDNLISGPQSGYNRLKGGKGQDTLRGGLGQDVYLFSRGDGQDVVEDAGGAGDGVAFQDVLRGDLRAQRSGNDLILTVSGGSDQVTIRSWFDSSVDTLDFISATDGYLDHVGVDKMLSAGVVRLGTTGDDTLTAADAGGDDTLVGGLGNDVYVVGRPADVVLEKAGEGIDWVRITNPATDAHFSINTAESAGVENMTVVTAVGSSARLTMTGNALNNQIGQTDSVSLGGGGRLEGLGGDDTLCGGRWGANTLAGGAGNDTYIIGRYGDTIEEFADEGIDTIDVSYNAGQAQGTVKLTDAQCVNVENIIYAMVGSGGIVQGNDLGNRITVYGMYGGTLDGGLGADTYVVQSGSGTLVFNDVGDRSVSAMGDLGNGGGLSIRSSVDVDLAQQAGASLLQLIGTANLGGAGTSGADTLLGNDGDNLLTGRAGDDVLTGGLGNDSYVFRSGDGADTITDVGGDADALLLQGVDMASLSFSKSASGQDLLISLGASTTDRLTVAGWFTAASSQIESIQAGSAVLHAQDINALVQAMAATGSGGTVMAVASVVPMASGQPVGVPFV